MTLWGTRPVDWILPGLLIVLWLTLRSTRRGMPKWGYGIGFALVLLCFPGGLVAAAREFDGQDCPPDDLCFSIDQVHWWLNGIMGLFTLGALILVTLIIDQTRRLSVDPDR